MQRVEVSPGVSINMPDDATDEEIEAVKARYAPKVRSKVQAPEQVETKAPPAKARKRAK